MVNIGINKSRDKIKRILFIQLPLLDHGKNYISSNYLYAPAILTEFINRNRKDVFSADWLDPFIVNNLSDERIVDHIIEYDPDTIGFTVFLWNAERALNIAALVKKKANIKIIFGGPEIYRESFLFYKQREYVDLFCSGEGEWFFDIFPKEDNLSLIQNNKVMFQPKDELVGIDKIYHTSIKNISRLSSGNTFFIEMTRGCPFRCCYCNYSKNSEKIRLKQIDILEREILNSNNEPIYLLAPSINTRPDFNDLLDMLISINNVNAIHAEVNAATITEETAHKMYKAGFTSVEAGLQTISEEARKRIKRIDPVESEIKGIANLQNAGISVKAGMIPGLPGDTVKTFKNGIDFTLAKGISESIEIYPLMVLPGTELVELYNEKGLDRQKYPPYYLIEKDDFNIDSIKKIIQYKDDKTGIVSTRRHMPDMSSSGKGHIKGFFIDIENSINLINVISQNVETSVCTIVVKTDKDEQIYRSIKEAVSDMTHPNTLINLVIESNTLVSDGKVKKILSEAERDTVYGRMVLFDDNENQSNLRIYQLFNDINEYDFAKIIYRKIDVICDIHNENVNKFNTYVTEGKVIPKVFVRTGLYSIYQNVIDEYYSSYGDCIEFESVEEKMLFCERNKIEFNRDLLNLKMIKL